MRFKNQLQKLNSYKYMNSIMNELFKIGLKKEIIFLKKNLKK